MKAKIIPLGMNDEQLRKRLAELSEDSARVQFSRHARQRMRQRKVIASQVLEVLRQGVVVEPAHRNIHGNWQCTLERRVAGDLVKVAAALYEAEGDWVVVITVIR